MSVGRAPEEAEALARVIAGFPPRRVLSDRRSAHETWGPPAEAALAREFELGEARLDWARASRARGASASAAERVVAA